MVTTALDEKRLAVAWVRDLIALSRHEKVHSRTQRGTGQARKAEEAHKNDLQFHHPVCR